MSGNENTSPPQNMEAMVDGPSQAMGSDSAATIQYSGPGVRIWPEPKWAMVIRRTLTFKLYFYPIVGSLLAFWAFRMPGRPTATILVSAFCWLVAAVVWIIRWFFRVRKMTQFALGPLLFAATILLVWVRIPFYLAQKCHTLARFRLGYFRQSQSRSTLSFTSRSNDSISTMLRSTKRLPFWKKHSASQFPSIGRCTPRAIFLLNSG